MYGVGRGMPAINQSATGRCRTQPNSLDGVAKKQEENRELGPALASEFA
jgi:hypothetical protein